jgi:hypothetical protein
MFSPHKPLHIPTTFERTLHTSALFISLFWDMTYQYEPLQDAATEIRVARVLSGAYYDEIRISFRKRRMEKDEKSVNLEYARSLKGSQAHIDSDVGSGTQADAALDPKLDASSVGLYRADQT